ncbi:predicted protein [Lichtheimia corymbifera JMRC:FSU:9682]|uniref:Uncharacterized protein n=1 Tax=Lichtheimia corymbifera JMRC:FSU:9682 TaxID=1263082 RepID=A0A068S7Y7_9FUNG|nr:predicted protein [Lichtheimia corymbifera JMRC:FSU:9682]
MPLTTRYLTATPHDVVRQILICQMAVAFITCFLTILTIHSSLYRVASSPLTALSSSRVEPPRCVIVTATDNPLILKSFFSTMSMDMQQRPSIIAYTTDNIRSADKDDLEHVMRRDDVLVTQGDEQQYVDHFSTLIYHQLSTNNNIVVWMDPSSSIVSGYLIHHLCSIVLEHHGFWSICPSETVCTILGVDTRNQTIRGMIHDMTLLFP